MDNVVYVGNLPAQVSTAELRAHFAKYGEVSNVEIVSDREASRTRPIGVVTMKDRTDAGRAIRALNGSFLMDRALVVGWMGGRVLPARPDRNAQAHDTLRPAASPAERVRPAPLKSEERRGSEDENGSERRRKGRAEVPKPAVRMLQQFRERANMTYELECSGTPLVIRVFFPLTDAAPEWRVEARTAKGSKVATGAASSRAAALATVASEWRAQDAAQSPADVDWAAVTEVMAAVRAI